MTRHLRLILPPPLITTSVAMLMFIPLLMAYSSTWIGAENTQGQFLVAMMTPIILAFGYGGYRAVKFHPCTNPRYRDWLATTPWSYGKPLPLGPLRLVWEDMIVVACFVITAALAYSQISIELIDKSGLVPQSLYVLIGITLLSFFAGYTLCLLASLKHNEVAPVTVLCLAPLIIYPHFNLWIAMIVLLVIYLIVNAAVRRSLSDFPFNRPEWLKDNRTQLLDAARSQGVIRWPFSHIGPRGTRESIMSLPVAVGISAIIAWWLLALIHGSVIFSEVATGFTRQELAEAMGQQTDGRPSFEESFWVLWIILCLFLAGARTLIYLIGTLPPISLIGRIGSGRIFVPGYDKVFVAPLAMLIYGAAAPWVLFRIGITPILVPAVSAFGLILIGLAVSPSLPGWRMTGQFRIRPWSSRTVENRSRPNEVKFSFNLDGQAR